MLTALLHNRDLVVFIIWASAFAVPCLVVIRRQTIAERRYQRYLAATRRTDEMEH